MYGLGARMSRFIQFVNSFGKTELVFLLLSVIFLSLAFLVFVNSSNLLNNNNDIVLTKNDDSQTRIYVDVAGAVEKPGVYEFSRGSRVKDALVVANGISVDADREYVARTINGAKVLTDGEKIFIPRQQINATSLENTSAEGGVLSTNVININSATITDLDSLPGVGEITAKKIIANRPYQNIIELKEKKIIGSSKFEKIKDLISIY